MPTSLENNAIMGGVVALISYSIYMMSNPATVFITNQVNRNEIDRLKKDD